MFYYTSRIAPINKGTQSNLFSVQRRGLNRCIVYNNRNDGLIESEPPQNTLFSFRNQPRVQEKTTFVSDKLACTRKCRSIVEEMEVQSVHVVHTRLSHTTVIYTNFKFPHSLNACRLFVTSARSCEHRNHIKRF